MMYAYPAARDQVLYQASPEWAAPLKSIRDRIHRICNAHLHRSVRVQTLDGHTYEGVIVHTDKHHVYLKVATSPADPSSPWESGRFFGPSDFAILTLVLFELLVIVLLL